MSPSVYGVRPIPGNKLGRKRFCHRDEGPLIPAQTVRDARSMRHRKRIEAAILARIEANNAGVEEAIMLNSEGFVAECTGDNVFIVHKGRLLTPPLIFAPSRLRIL